MALGELYSPRGLALETARFVLQVKNPYACNVALGCPNGCLYCYGSKAYKKKDWTCVRYPKKPPAKLIKKQMHKWMLDEYPDGVFIPFATDPWHNDKVSRYTSDLVNFLLRNNVPRVAVLSKLKSKPRHVFPCGYIQGITLVSLSRNFRKRWEPNADPQKVRIRDLLVTNAFGNKTFVSLEPLPCPAIHKIKLPEILEEVKFADAMIMGKWNYDRRTTTQNAKEYYGSACWEFRDWCKSNGVRWHVKTPTLKFVGLENNRHFDHRDR